MENTITPALLAKIAEAPYSVEIDAALAQLGGGVMKLSPEQEARIAEFNRAARAVERATENETFMKKVADLGGADPSQFVNRKERRAHMKKVRCKTQGTQP